MGGDAGARGVDCGSIERQNEWERRELRDREGAVRRGELEEVEDGGGRWGEPASPRYTPPRPAGLGLGLQPSAPSAAPRPRRGIDN